MPMPTGPPKANPTAVQIRSVMTLHHYINLSPVIKDKARGVIGGNSEIRSEIHRSRKREENYAEEH